MGREPNGALVAEVADMDPGRALDVGCGEGADAIWLADRGWDVTALDVSGVARQRAAEHAEESGVKISWVHAGLVAAALDPASFDLVSAQYFVLPRTPGLDIGRLRQGSETRMGIEPLYRSAARVDRIETPGEAMRDQVTQWSPAHLVRIVGGTDDCH